MSTSNTPTKMKKRTPKSRKGVGGRPSVLTESVVQKLEEAFLLGCTDLEACLVAGISKSTLYNYQEANPKFLERKEALKETPTYIARKTVVDRLPRDPDLALKYLERKKKGEFSVRSEHTGKDGGPVQLQPVQVMEVADANKQQTKSNS